jgi:hypothetical protein
MKPLLRHAAAGLLALSAATALACGYCIEDRVAAVYDQALVDQALARHHHVAFLGIEAGAVDESATGAVRRVLESVPGIDKRSLHAKAENAAVAVAYDPARTSLARVVASANGPLARRGITLAALRVIDEGGKLREP